MVGKVGDGFVVVTARGVASTLNRTQVNGAYVANNAHRAFTPLFDRSSDAAAKLAWSRTVAFFKQHLKG